MHIVVLKRITCTLVIKQALSWSTVVGGEAGITGLSPRGL